MAAGAIVVASVTLAGCGIGQSNETQKEREVEQAASQTTGALHFNDVYITPVGQEITPEPGGLTLAPSETPIVSPPASTPAPSSTSSSAGSVDGYLVASVTNGNGFRADKVLGVQVGGATGGASVTLAPAGAPTTVPPNGILRFKDPAGSSTGPFLIITGMTQPLRIGTTVPVTFTVQGEGQLPTIQVPVISSFLGTPPASPPVPISSSASASSSASPKASKKKH